MAALLLLAGYSINDTVVVFDRLRENRRKYKRMSLPDMINLSTNQIATRTTLVSAATALSVIPLLFGGPVLLNFSVAILFGIVVGTFSSTYVAAMLLLYLPAVGGGKSEAKSGRSDRLASGRLMRRTTSSSISSLLMAARFTASRPIATAPIARAPTAKAPKAKAPKPSAAQARPRNGQPPRHYSGNQSRLSE